MLKPKPIILLKHRILCSFHFWNLQTRSNKTKIKLIYYKTSFFRRSYIWPKKLITHLTTLLLRPSLTQIKGAGLLGKIIIFYLVRGKKKTIFYFIPAYSSFFISRLNKIFFYNIFNPLFMLCGIHDW